MDRPLGAGDSSHFSCDGDGSVFLLDVLTENVLPVYTHRDFVPKSLSWALEEPIPRGAVSAGICPEHKTLESWNGLGWMGLKDEPVPPLPW